MGSGVQEYPRVISARKGWRLSHGVAPKDGMGFLYLLNCMNLSKSLIICMHATLYECIIMYTIIVCMYSNCMNPSVFCLLFFDVHHRIYATIWNGEDGHVHGKKDYVDKESGEADRTTYFRDVSCEYLAVPGCYGLNAVENHSSQSVG